MMPVGVTHVVTFHEHPRLIVLATGECVKEWPELATGTQIGPLDDGRPQPVVAMDPRNARFAVATETEIVIVDAKV